MAGIGRARRSGLRAPCLLFTLGTIAAVEPPLVIATFDWRYELPQLSLIPIAAVLGVTHWSVARDRAAIAANGDQLVPVSQRAAASAGTTGGTAWTSIAGDVSRPCLDDIQDARTGRS